MKITECLLRYNGYRGSRASEVCNKCKQGDVLNRNFADMFVEARNGLSTKKKTPPVIFADSSKQEKEKNMNEESQQTETKRVCKDCGLPKSSNEFRNEKTKICTSCIQEKVSKTRKDNKGKVRKPKQKTQRQEELKLVLNFTEHADLFESLRKSSMDNFRSIELQAMWFISDGLISDGLTEQN